MFTRRLFEQRLSSGTLVIALIGSLAACSASSKEGPQVSAGPATAVEKDPTLGTIDGAPIRESDLSPETKRALLDAENDMQQRHMHKLWLAFEQEVSDRLIVAEAKKRGISVEKLRKEEIDDKTPEVSDADVRAAYDRAAADIEIPFEKAAPIIKRQMRESVRSERESAYIETLRESAKVKTTIPVPSLPRYKVDFGHAQSIGPENAKVTIVEFSDFQCPYCRQAHHVISELLKLYPNDLRVVFRDYPLPMHPQARPAAIAAECAGEQGKFWEYHNKLFEDQALAAADLSRYAQEVGLKLDDFQSCLQNSRAESAVREDEEAAKALNVSGTPAMFVNGIKLIGLLPLPLMQSLIDHELAR